MYQNRAAYIDELHNFINCSKNSFENVLKTINWTKQSLLSVKEVEACQNPEEVAVHNTSATEEGTAVEGLNNESGGGDLLYNDIVASLLVNDQPSKTVKKDVKAEDKAAALIQLLKMERDAKRRRISYKNKVHTKNKSHTEVLREVLEEQMLTITGSSENDSCVAANDRLQQSTNQAQELIAIQPPQGNPHLAWLGILEKAEGARKGSDYQSDKSRAQKSEYRNRHSADYKEIYRIEEEKERKKHRKDTKRKVEDNGKHHDREKNNEWDDMDGNSPNHKDRHHKKKKKKRSRSQSPRPEISDHHRHKSKHKKKKH